jgi:hypothetical protein
LKAEKSREPRSENWSTLGRCLIGTYHTAVSSTPRIKDVDVVGLRRMSHESRSSPATGRPRYRVAGSGGSYITIPYMKFCCSEWAPYVMVTCNQGGTSMLHNSRSSREKVRLHRERLRAQGLRPVQIWVPDVRARSFIAAARKQSKAVAASEQETADQQFIDAVSEDAAE